MESRPKRSGRSIVAAALCWVCLIAMVALIYHLRTSGDRTSLATVLIFSPRLVFALPVVLLLPMLVYRSCWIPILLLIFTALFPLMGLCVSWHRLTAHAPVGQPIRVLAFNLHHLDFNTPGFTQYLINSQADVLLFAEMPGRVNRQNLPPGLTHVTRHGELCVASRYPIHTLRIIKNEVAIRYTLDTPAGSMDLIGVHLSSPHWALRDSIDGSEQGTEELARNINARREESEALASEIQQRADHPLVIAGDFNLAPDSPLFISNFSMMTDAFESAGFGFGWTYYHQHAMVRIDHVVANEFVQFKACSVGPSLGSPHRPVVADLVLSKQ